MTNEETILKTANGQIAKIIHNEYNDAFDEAQKEKMRPLSLPQIIDLLLHNTNKPKTQMHVWNGTYATNSDECVINNDTQGIFRNGLYKGKQLGVWAHGETAVLAGYAGRINCAIQLRKGYLHNDHDTVKFLLNGYNNTYPVFSGDEFREKSKSKEFHKKYIDFIIVDELDSYKNLPSEDLTVEELKKNKLAQNRIGSVYQTNKYYDVAEKILKTSKFGNWHKLDQVSPPNEFGFDNQATVLCYGNGALANYIPKHKTEIVIGVKVSDVQLKVLTHHSNPTTQINYLENIISKTTPAKKIEPLNLDEHQNRGKELIQLIENNLKTYSRREKNTFEAWRTGINNNLDKTMFKDWESFHDFLDVCDYDNENYTKQIYPKDNFEEEALWILTGSKEGYIFKPVELLEPAITSSGKSVYTINEVAKLIKYRDASFKFPKIKIDNRVTTLMIDRGFHTGMSSITDSYGGFVRNEEIIRGYYCHISRSLKDWETHKKYGDRTARIYRKGE